MGPSLPKRLSRSVLYVEKPVQGPPGPDTHLCVKIQEHEKLCKTILKRENT